MSQFLSLGTGTSDCVTTGKPRDCVKHGESRVTDSFHTFYSSRGPLGQLDIYFAWIRFPWHSGGF